MEFEMTKNALRSAVWIALLFVLVVCALVATRTETWFTQEDAIERYGLADRAEVERVKVGRSEARGEAERMRLLLAEESRRRDALQRELLELKRKLKAAQEALEPAPDIEPEEEPRLVRSPEAGLPEGHVETFSHACSGCHEEPSDDPELPAGHAETLGEACNTCHDVG